MGFRATLLLVLCAAVVACSDEALPADDAGGSFGVPDAGPSAPDAPLGVIASDAEFVDEVTVRWEPVDGATSYDLYRDGELIAPGLRTTSHDDLDAAPGGVPEAPIDLRATDGLETEHVRLDWRSAVVPAGAEHQYSVVAVNEVGQSEPSQDTRSSRGRRAGFPVTDYELSHDGLGWTSIGTTSPFLDTDAPLATLDVIPAEASDGVSRTEIDLYTGVTAIEAVQSYQLRAVNAVGTGPASEVETGYREVGELAFQWERSDADADGGYAALAGATGPTFTDPTAPADGEGRYYRCVVSAPGADGAVSLADRGHRYADWPDLPRADFWRPNGAVRALAHAGGAIYVGGDFDYVGPPTGTFAAVDAVTGAPDLGRPHVHGQVRAIAPDGAGGHYLAGAVVDVGGVARESLVRVDATGALVDAFDAFPNGMVFEMVWAGDRLYVAGNFSYIAGYPRAGLAAVDAVTGEVLDWNPDPDGAVANLAVDGDTVYVGGDFTTVGGQPRAGLAALDATTGDATAWAPNPDGRVGAIESDGTRLFVAGWFENIAGQPRSRLASFDVATGALTGWDPDPNATVSAMAVAGGTLYVAGTFTLIGGQARSRAAALDASTGAVTQWNPSPDDGVDAVHVDGNTVYLGGSFGSVGGALRARIAAVDATTGTATAWDPGAGGSVHALAVDGGTVHVGGSFSSVGGETRNRLAAMDVATGVATGWDPDANGTVSTVVIVGDTAYAGGRFLSVAGQARNRLAAIDRASGIPTAWDPGADGEVRAVAVSGGTVYVGGDFDNAGGQPRGHVAALDAVTGAATAWDPGADDVVRALAVSGDTVYVGGRFAQIAGESRAYAAALDATTGAATGWDPGAGGQVWTFALQGSTVYLGGAVGATLHAVDATTGADTGWNPSVGGGAPVRDILATDRMVYVVGDFYEINRMTRPTIAEIDAAGAFPTAWDPDPAGTVHALELAGDTLFVGGSGGLDVFDR